MHMKPTSIILSVLFLLLFSGCLQQRTMTYICPGGSEVTDPSSCSIPQQSPEVPAAPPAQEQPPAENETLSPPPEPPPEAPPNISCYKEDGGDKFVKSAIVLRSNSDVLQHEEDACLSPSDLKEFYCQGEEIHYTTYECRNGCGDGKCNRELVRSECSDTDGAASNHLNKRGQIIYTDYYSDGSTEERFLVEDYCDGTTLVEYSCPSPLDTTSRYRRSELACLGCSDGACPYN